MWWVKGHTGHQRGRESVGRVPGDTKVPMDVEMVEARTTKSSYFIKKCHNGSDTFYAAFFFFKKKSVSH